MPLDVSPWRPTWAGQGLHLLFRFSARQTQTQYFPLGEGHSRLRPAALRISYGHYGYVINEMANTVTAFAYDAAKGELNEIQVISTMPSDLKGTSYTAEVQVHPSGKFFYGSNRGHNSIAMSRSTRIPVDSTPADSIDTRQESPQLRRRAPLENIFLAESQDSDSIVIFNIDPSTGLLRPTGQTVKLPRPVCIKMIPRSAIAGSRADSLTLDCRLARARRHICSRSSQETPRLSLKPDERPCSHRR